MSDHSPATDAASQNVTPPRPTRSRIGWLLGIGLLMAAVIGGVVYWQQQAGAGAGAAATVQAMPPPEVTVATPGAIQMDFAAIPYRRKRDMAFFPRVADPLKA